MSVAEIGFMIGLLCGIAGCVTIVLTDRADARARRRASAAYWAEQGREAAIRRHVSQLCEDAQAEAERLIRHERPRD